jgi:hypothetical protein
MHIGLLCGQDNPIEIGPPTSYLISNYLFRTKNRVSISISISFQINHLEFFWKEHLVYQRKIIIYFTILGDIKVEV